MKKMILAAGLVSTALISAHASDIALTGLKSAAGEKAVSAAAVTQPQAIVVQPQMIKITTVEKLEIRVTNATEAHQKLGEIRANLEKAGLVYIAGTVQSGIGFTAVAMYAVSKQVPVDTPMMAAFEIETRNSADAWQIVKEAQESMAKAGLIYVAGTVNSYSTGFGARIDYLRAQN